MNTIVYHNGLNGMLFYMIDFALYYHKNVIVHTDMLDEDTKNIIQCRYNNDVMFNNTINKEDLIVYTYQTYDNIKIYQNSRIMLYSNKLHRYIVNNNCLPLEILKEQVYADTSYLHASKIYPKDVLCSNIFINQKRVVLQKYLPQTSCKIQKNIIRDYDFVLFDHEREAIELLKKTLDETKTIYLSNRVITNILEYQNYFYCLSRGFFVRSLIEGILTNQNVFLLSYRIDDVAPFIKTTIKYDTFFEQIQTIDYNCFILGDE